MPHPSRDMLPAQHRFGLVSDDLTGACDAGVQFAQCGFSTLVHIAPPGPEIQPFEVAVLTTNSRGDTPAIARGKVREACRALLAQNREIIYKKIDSTLRGNLGGELESVMESCGFSVALVAPAFPAMARTLEGGWLLVAGSRPPVRVHLPKILRRQCGLCVVELDRASWATGFNALLGRLNELPQENTIVALDSTSDDELEAIAHAAIRLSRQALLAGSAGLAAATAKVLAETFHKIPPPIAPPSASKRDPGPVVLVMGSTHPVTQAQIEYLGRSQRVARVELDGTAFRKALAAIQNGRNLLVVPGPEDEGHLKEFLGILANSSLRGVTLSGGDTAFAASRGLGAGGIKLEGELLPGIPVGRFVGGPANGLAVVTKAGGFGGVDALAVITEFLAHQTRTG
jgi:D-threonate/D-erythronate kinase